MVWIGWGETHAGDQLSMAKKLNRGLAQYPAATFPRQFGRHPR